MSPRSLHPSEQLLHSVDHSFSASNHNGCSHALKHEQEAARLPRSPARLHLSEAASRELQGGRREPLTCVGPATGAAAAATRELLEPPGRGGGRGIARGSATSSAPPPAGPAFAPAPAGPAFAPAPAGPASGAGRRPSTAPKPQPWRPGAGAARRRSAGCGKEPPPPASGSVKSKRLRLSPSSELTYRKKKMCPKSLVKGVEIPSL
ncbi:unnamed protein product [Rangifer tarandus platyrhynchus]|uniref:Uncharacterized protein n=3 Tax=Rangifer tarandus platyrhynchus TaxID=3082113 RepID=A0ACB0E886_RANTA|nr:unnamed protein product [Rangifer tarandus platyrhynchus]CAI9696616.1 unnamed protein product [Rangifer tarandus platyrhynchus]